jgi:mannose-6-phosphate isomerase-like protein (cupin superfamily)
VKHFYQISEIEERRQRSGKSYLEFLRIPVMSAGLYVLPPGGSDPQSPHKEDEVYYVVQGRARMQVGSEDQAVAAGSVIFVQAGVEHRFHDVEEGLEILVFFAPAES